MRTNQTAFIDGVNKRHVCIVGLFEFEFDEVTFRFTDCNVPIEAGGFEWVPGQTVGAVSHAEETNGEVSGMRFTLNALDGSAIPLALQDDYQERKVSVYSLLLNAETYQPIGQPIYEWGGVLDQATISIGEQCIVSYTAESELIDLDRARPKYRNQADHERLYPMDLFYSQAQAVTKTPITLVGKEYFYR